MDNVDIRREVVAKLVGIIHPLLEEVRTVTVYGSTAKQIGETLDTLRTALDRAEAEIERLERWRAEERAKHLRVREANKGFQRGLARANATIKAMKTQYRLNRIGVADAIGLAERDAKITNQRRQINDLMRRVEADKAGI